MDQFNQKLNQLPLDVQDFLLSDFGKQIERKIVKQFVPAEGNLSILGNIVTNLYFGDLKIKDLINKLKEDFKLDEADVQKFACEILGMRVLVVEKFILDKYGDDIVGFIDSLGGNLNNYDAAVIEFKTALDNEKRGIVSGVSSVNIKKNIGDNLFSLKFDIKKEAEDTLDVFENMLASLLENNSVLLLEEFNLTLLQLLNDYHDFGNKLERALYKNIEKITHKNFVLDKKAKAPSIKNWLRYFIKTHGSGIFNNLELTKFISEADNCKELDAKEKKVLSKLLHTYRNIKFFPQSMENLAPEQWEIIPFERKEEKSRASQLKHAKKPSKADLITELKGNVDDYAEGSLEREILEEESAKDQEHHKLLLLAKKYPEGSLERRAVEDEIAKLEK